MKYLGEILPNNMIPLATNKGKNLLEDSKLKNESMVENFKQQIGLTTCGPASLALLINSINASYRVKLSDPAITGEDYEKFVKNLESGEKLLLNEYDLASHGNAKDFIKEIDVDTNGTTLLQLDHLAMLLGFGVNTYFAYKDEMEMKDEKRNELKKMVAENSNKFILSDSKELQDFIYSYITRPNTGLLFNYHMAKLGYATNFGHHSPAAAAIDDSVLIMDVWPDTQPAWVNIELMFNAMCCIDSDSGLPRGFLHVYELM